VARRYVASVTRRGQVTIPAEVRRLLRTEDRPKVVFHVEDGSVRMAPVEMTLEEVLASPTPLGRPSEDEELSNIAKEEKARSTVEEMRRS
jgi:AbrB family looped-hinge helix DNA binding protein